MDERVKKYLQEKYGFGPGLSAEDLAAEQSRASDNRFTADLGSAGNTIGAAIAGVKADNSFYDKLRDGAGQGVKDLQERRKGMLDQVTMNDTVTKSADEDERRTRERDSNSSETQLARTLAKKLLPSFDSSQMSAEQINTQIPSLQKIYEAEQQRLGRIDELSYKNASLAVAREDKAVKEAKLSDKQVESVTDYDNLLNNVEHAAASLGDKSNFVGPVDGMLPDLMVGDEQVAFRAAIGRIKDAYRKLITGAGASNKELMKLESRLPSEYDTYDNFQSKTKDYIREVGKARQQYLENHAKVGKDVKAFDRPSSDQSASFPRQVKRVDPQTGKTVTATVQNEKELREATGEGFQ